MLDPIFAYIDSHREDYLEELYPFLRCRGISTTNEGMHACAGLLAEMMRDTGIDHVTVFETGRHPVVYGEVLTDPGLPTQLVYGHYDVQPPEPYDQWDSDPFEPVIRDERIYCRGVSDNKAQLFAYLKGMEAYRKTQGSLPINIKYLFEGEEEIGSVSLEPFVREHTDLLKADACLYSDGHFHESGKPVLTLGHKGIAYIEIKLTEAKRDIHSMYAGCIANPVWRMARLLGTLVDETGAITIDGFYDAVEEPALADRESVRYIPVDKEDLKSSYKVERFLNNRTGDNFYYNLTFEPTCNISGIYAGHTGDGTKTVLPGTVTARLDLRLVPRQDPEEVFRQVKSHLAARGYEDAEVKLLLSSWPARTPVSDVYVDVCKKAVKRAFGEEPIVFPCAGGFGPRYIIDRLLRIPAVEIPLATADQRNHAPNENMGLDGFYKGIKTAASLIYYIGQVKKPKGD